MSSRIFFITDVHGSTRCFKKFLNSAKFYKANVLVLGGDITGKALIPLVDQGDGTFRCAFEGEELWLKSKEEAEHLAARAADSGLYTRAMSRKEVGELSADPREVTRVFNEAMVSRVGEWMALAEDPEPSRQVRHKGHLLRPGGHRRHLS